MHTTENPSTNLPPLPPLAVSAILAFVATCVLAAAGPAAAQVDKDLTKCLSTSGNLGVKCLQKGAKILAEQVAPPEGLLAALTAKTLPKTNKKCTVEHAETLGYLSRTDIARRVNEACVDFAYELNAIVYSEEQVGLTDAQRKCRQQMYKLADKVRKTVSQAWGKKCIVADYKGKGCDRAKRDEKVDKVRTKSEAKLEKICGADFDAIVTFPETTLQERIAELVDVAVVRGRHIAQRVYPPNNFGPTADFGPAPVGVQTLELVDASRLNVAGDGPRPVTVEVYYPSTEAAIEGVPRDVVTVLGFTIVETPAYRDVDLALGTFPMVAFSHGNEGIRNQSFFFAAHLASHGYIVVSPDHHGNTLYEAFDDPDGFLNRPLDVSFVIDEFLAFNTTPADFFENSIDAAAIGASGHSLGGFTSFALAGGETDVGTLTDPRIVAIFPQAPFAPFADEFFATIPLPTLIVGGTIDETTPFDAHQQRPFDLMTSGASIVALAELRNAGHRTFSEQCEIPASLLDLIGGAEAACEPRHLPWRHGHDITKYLALNFFDAVLKDDVDALGRLSPAVVNDFDDLRYESK